jgi:MFS family permease
MALYHVMYCFGYVCGSLLGGWVVDRWGRRKGIFVGALVYCCATMCVVLSQPHNYVMVLAARFIQGIGSGKYSVAVLAYAVEIAPKTQRGLFAGLTPLAAASGFFLAPTLAQVAREFGDAKEMSSDEIGWKLAVCFAILPQLFVAAGALFLPESPRWAYRHKGRLAAAVILHLLQPETVITAELNLIDDEVTRETQRNGHLQASSSLGDLWRAAHVRRRIVIVMAMQVLQQAIAASTVLSLAGLIFEVQAKESQSGEPSGVDITQALAGIALLVIFPALGLIEILGRRLMLLIGAAGTFFALFGAGLVLELGCDGATVESMTCTTFAKDCFIVSMAFGVGMSAMSWGLVCWTYSAEVFGFCVRARAISMAVVATWLMAAAMVFSATYNRKKHASTEFFLLACASIVAGLVAYFWCVETKGVELEMVEALFCQHVPARGAAEVKSADIPTPSVAESDAPYRMESVSSSIDKMPHLI